MIRMNSTTQGASHHRRQHHCRSHEHKWAHAAAAAASAAAHRGRRAALRIVRRSRAVLHASISPVVGRSVLWTGCSRSGRTILVILCKRRTCAEDQKNQYKNGCQRSNFHRVTLLDDVENAIIRAPEDFRNGAFPMRPPNNPVAQIPVQDSPVLWCRRLGLAV